MRGLLLWTALFGSVSAFAQTKFDPPAPLQRSVSSSQQFVIYHSDRALRSRLAQRAEDLKSQWLRRLKLGDDWKSPIIIQVLAIAATGMLLVFERTLRERRRCLENSDRCRRHGSIEKVGLRLEIYRALFLEFGYRNVPAKAGKALSPTAGLAGGRLV